jgi:hypothetical protein
MTTWENVGELSPEEQTAWLKSRMVDWERFVADIQQSDAQLEAHESSGAGGPPPGSVTIEEYRQRRALRTQAE